MRRIILTCAIAWACGCGGQGRGLAPEDEGSAGSGGAETSAGGAGSTGGSGESSGTGGTGGSGTDGTGGSGGAIGAGGGDGGEGGEGDTGPNSVLVYSNNIENMIYDWKDLVHVMARDSRSPDLFLVQQMTDRKRLEELAAFMTERLGEKYDGVVAQDNPTHQRFGAQVTPKPTVTTGVIFRSARFAYVSHESWFPFGTKEGGEHTCGKRTSNSGYETIRVLLEDKAAKKQVAVASLRHWTWMDCSLKNMIEMIDGEPSGANAHAPMPDVALQIVGGDFNGKAFDSAGNYRCWYRLMNHALGGEDCAEHENLGFGDPLYVKCEGVKACVRAGSGIDFVFGRRKGGKPARASGFRVVSYEAGDAADVAETGKDRLSNRVSTHGFDDVETRYSGHRARRAVFYYE